MLFAGAELELELSSLSVSFEKALRMVINCEYDMYFLLEP